MAIFVTGNGNYNSLFSKIYQIFDYFCTVVPYFEYFWVIFVNSSFAFSSAFVSRVPQSTEPLYFFRVQIRIWKKNRFVFRKNGKSGKKILSHCLNPILNIYRFLILIQGNLFQGSIIPNLPLLTSYDVN